MRARARARCCVRRASPSRRIARTTPRSSVPYIGMVTILLNDYPKLKYVLVGVMGLFVLTTKE